MAGKNISVITLLLFLTTHLYAQHAGSISGIIIDAKTKERVPFATVFFGNTLFATRSDADGSYRMMNIPPGKYNMTVTSVGYNIASVPVVILARENTLNIAMVQDVKILKEVTVKSLNSDYLRNLRRFKKYFLGETFNATKCRILNIEDITISYDFDTRVLTASCNKPIIVENKSLGYTVRYLLQKFTVDDKTGIFIISGIPRFDAMVPSNRGDARHWSKERDRAYHGSLTHFMRSLKYSCLTDDGFLLYQMKLTNQKTMWIGDVEKIRDSLYSVIRMRESDLFNRPYDEHTFIKVVYVGESQESGFPGAVRSLGSPQTSWLKFQKHALVIYDNGYFEDELSYRMDGYFGWINGVAEMIPLEYQPGEPANTAIGTTPNSFANSSMSGTILDAVTGQPVPNSVIFISNSTLKGNVSSNGTYSFTDIPGGRYDLIVTAPGYEMRKIPWRATAAEEKYSWILERKVVEPADSIRQSKKMTAEFNEYFLGITDNSRRCSIRNPEDVVLHYDAAKKIVRATAQKPIVIENQALGYSITCWLESFFYNEQEHSYGTDSECLLTPMDDEKKQKTWSAARKKEWEGSFLQFMESMRARTLRQDHYELFRKEGSEWVSTDEAWMFSDRLDLPVELKVIYTSESSESNYTGEPQQTSYVILTKEALRPWPNIYLRTPGFYSLGGYFAYIDGIADIIPQNYRPVLKK